MLLQVLRLACAWKKFILDVDDDYNDDDNDDDVDDDDNDDNDNNDDDDDDDSDDVAPEAPRPACPEWSGRRNKQGNISYKKHFASLDIIDLLVLKSFRGFSIRAQLSARWQR